MKNSLLPDLGRSASLLFISAELPQRCNINTVLGQSIYYSFVVKKTPLPQVIKEIKEMIEDNRAGVANAIGEELTERIENL